jgi:hypothetical protein
MWIAVLHMAIMPITMSNVKPWFRGENADVDAFISNISIRIRTVITVIKCGYYPLSAHGVMGILGIEFVISASNNIIYCWTLLFRSYLLINTIIYS